MKAGRFLLCILLSLTLVVTFIPVCSFAENDESAETVVEEVQPKEDEVVAEKDYLSNKKAEPNAEKVTVKKGSIEAHLSNDEKSQLKKAIESVEGVQAFSYSDPEVDDFDDPSIELYVPDPWDTVTLGDYIDFDYNIFDIWESYYTIPLVCTSDEDGDLVDLVEGDTVVGVDEWYNYSGYIYLDPAKYHKGTYELWVFGVPCYSDGTPVEDWGSWDNVPYVHVYFDVECLHSWKHYKKAAGLLSNGTEYDYCTICKIKRNVKSLKGYATYYVKSFKVTKGKACFTAKWAKQSAAIQKKFNGYQIRYSINSNMAGAKYAYAAKSSKSKKISKLKKKKKYYVQVRTYTKKNGITFYSKWSAKKSVKTK